MMWARLTETPFLVALISVLSAAIIVPAIKKLYFDVQTRLRVDVRIFPHQISETLKKTARETLKAPYGSLISDIVNAKGYIVVTITNISKRKIAGVTIMAPESIGEMTCQIDEAEELQNLRKGNRISIGDIQPGHVRVLHIWTNFDRSDGYFGSIKKLFHVSADEVDSVRFRFPMPKYILVKHVQRVMWIISALSLLLAFGFPIMVFVLK